MNNLPNYHEMPVFRIHYALIASQIILQVGMILLLVLGDFTNIGFLVIILPIVLLVVVLVLKRISFLSLVISEDAIFTQPFFKKLSKFLDKSQIDRIIIRKNTDSLYAEVIYHKMAEQHTLNLQSHFHQVKGYSAQQSRDLFEQLLVNLLKDSPEKSSIIVQKNDKDKLSIFDNKPILARVFLYGALLIFAITLYVDMMIIKSLHFATDFMLPVSILVGIFALLGFVLLRDKKQKSSYITAIVFGAIFGLIVSHAGKSYVHWSNENNPNLTVKYYPILLDDFDKQDKTQRWLFSDELQTLTYRERIYLRNSQIDEKRQTGINENLAENQSYLIPVKFGTFNDIMIDRRAFQHPQPVNNNEGINND